MDKFIVVVINLITLIGVPIGFTIAIIYFIKYMKSKSEKIKTLEKKVTDLEKKLPK